MRGINNLLEEQCKFTVLVSPAASHTARIKSTPVESCPEASYHELLSSW